GLFEVNEVAEIVAETADSDANIIFGAVIDEELQDQIFVTVIATGFEQTDKTAKLKSETELNINPFRSEDLDIPAFLRKK
ncbi:MAG: cell division protein FtsZ, partial [Firmicutes bacterium]|nr:cell division protein FtsZ [Bacillota bacterium]